MHNLNILLEEALSALRLIAVPARPDGTYNRDRRACEQLASATLAKIEAQLTPAVANKPATGAMPVLEGQRFIAYSDGSCKSNPGPAGWGVVILDERGQFLEEARGFIGEATNQVAELSGAIAALRLTPVGALVELVSDSQYVLKGISEWRKGWEAKGWRNAKNEAVANKEVWKVLFALVDERQVTTRWVKGHNGDEYNERCDVLAGQAVAFALMAEEEGI